MQKFEKISGLKINFDKTKMFIYDKSIRYNSIKKVSKFKYLGITYKKNGKILWDEILSKFKNRLEKVSNMKRHSALLHKVYLINSYVLSVVIYPLRVVRIPKGFAKDLYSMIRSSLGSRASRVRLTRLMGARCFGGYGLLNLKEMALRLKRSWLQYLICCEESLFLKVMNRWNTKVKNYFNLDRGPILGGCGKVSGFCWSFLINAWNSPWRCYNLKGVYRMYECNQLHQLIEIVRCTESSGVDKHGIHYSWSFLTPLGSSEMEILRNFVSSFFWRNKVVGYNLAFKKDWKRDKEFDKTPAQKRWLSKGKDFIEWAKSSNVSRVKMWAWDGININLPLRYKTDICLVCSGIIGSEHFLWACPLINKLSLYLAFLPVEIAFIVWRLHCAIKHDGDNAITHMFWATQWVLFGKCDVGRQWKKLEPVFRDAIQSINERTNSLEDSSV